MKKFLSLFLSFLLVLVMVQASADSNWHIWLSEENLFPDNAQKITLTVGTWEVGKDIPAGYYRLSASSLCTAFMSDTINELGEAQLSGQFKWIDNKPEFILRDGFYIQINWGKITFTPIVLTTEQEENETYMQLTECRLNAMWDVYECEELFGWGVDVGTYVVGLDIPAGNWQIRYGDMFAKTLTVTHNGEKQRCTIYSPSGNFYRHDLLTATYMELEEGAVIEIEETTRNYGSLVFIPMAPHLFK
jgi:hypothetical protein